MQVAGWTIAISFSDTIKLSLVGAYAMGSRPTVLQATRHALTSMGTVPSFATVSALSKMIDVWGPKYAVPSTTNVIDRGRAGELGLRCTCTPAGA